MSVLSFVFHSLAILAYFLGVSILVYTKPVFAAPVPTTCRGLVHELNAMKKAQNQIITSLAQNHEAFANQLSDLSFELALYKKTVPQKALVAMEKSAQAYRGRSEKAFQTAEKLETSTEDLIQRIQGCLK